MIIKNFTLIAFASLVLLTACGDKNDAPEKRPTADAHTLKVNNFIAEVMNTVYLWNETLPNIDNQYEINSMEYFSKMLHQEDEYSMVTDDIESLLASYEGVEKSFGLSLTFVYTSSLRKEVYAIVDYIYPNSPASMAGIKRGDAIVALNNNPITEHNLSDFFEKASISISVGQVTTSNEVINIKQKALSSVVLVENPIHTYRIIETGGKKIGYLFYTSFIASFNSQLDEVFASFKAAGVTEFILDLRYNLGGSGEAIIHLCSYLAPRVNVENADIIMKTRHNKQFEAYYKEQGISTNYCFDKRCLLNNLDLKKIYILTSDKCASASEATLLGLKPYMTDVISIGTKTHGKYLGSSIFQPFIDKDKLDPEIKNWGVVPIICEYVNNNNESAKGGISPKYVVDRMTFPLIELTDNTEPMIARALQLISGGTTYRSGLRSTVSPLEIVPGTPNPSDRFRRNLILQ